ncbi:hypothetical protein [Photobacterium phosphoreum]|nr:hypothetical protein [Photobacterium phosphoreum]
MSLEMIAEGLKVVAQTVIDNEYDIHLTVGLFVNYVDMLNVLI